MAFGIILRTAMLAIHDPVQSCSLGSEPIMMEMKGLVLGQHLYVPLPSHSKSLQFRLAFHATFIVEYG